MQSSTAWTFLLIAGILEIVWALGLKSTDGFSRWVPSVVVLAFMGASFYCLAQAVRGLPVGTAYAVWTGIGAAGTAILAILLGKEPFSGLRLACIGLIIAGVAGLKYLAK